MGFDFPALLLLLFLMIIFGLLIFRLSRRVFRRTLKGASDKKINVLSRVCAIFLAPLLLVGILAAFMYAVMEMAPEESNEEMTSHHYKMMEKDIAKDLKPGMSKTEVLALFGESDTTQSVMVYDLSLPAAKEKYILEITFEQHQLSSFRRKQ